MRLVKAMALTLAFAMSFSVIGCGGGAAVERAKEADAKDPANNPTTAGAAGQGPGMGSAEPAGVPE